jgi:hypothetical protein
MLRTKCNEGLVVCRGCRSVVSTITADGVAHALDMKGQAATARVVHGGWQLDRWGGVGPQLAKDWQSASGHGAESTE